MIKRFRWAFLVALFTLLLPHTVLAAPFAEAEAVNLPGWVGGLLAILALLTPILFQLWVKQQK